MVFMKSSYSKSVSCNSRKNEEIKKLSRVLFHRGYFDFVKSTMEFFWHAGQDLC